MPLNSRVAMFSDPGNQAKEGEGTRRKIKHLRLLSAEKREETNQFC